MSLTDNVGVNYNKRRKPIFNVGTRYVEFAPGNLQALEIYKDGEYMWYSSNWKFAEHQYDSYKSNGRFIEGNNVDLFCWSGESSEMSGYGLCTYQDYNNQYYGTVDVEPLKCDWGSIPSIVSRYGSGWRTPTIQEWTYLVTHYDVCAVWVGDNITGVLILADEVKQLTDLRPLPNANDDGTDINQSVINSMNFEKLEYYISEGCLFLPTTQYRDGTEIITSNTDMGFNGYYWSSTSESVKHAYRLAFNDSGFGTTKYTSRRHYGRAVRLVKNVS